MRKLLNRPIRSMSRTTSLKAKLTVFFSLVVVVIAVVLSLSFFYQTRKTLIEAFKNRGSLLALNLSYNGRYGVFVEDRQILHDLMEGGSPGRRGCLCPFPESGGKDPRSKIKGRRGKKPGRYLFSGGIGQGPLHRSIRNQIVGVKRWQGDLRLHGPGLLRPSF